MRFGEPGLLCLGCFGFGQPSLLCLGGEAGLFGGFSFGGEALPFGESGRFHEPGFVGKALLVGAALFGELGVLGGLGRSELSLLVTAGSFSAYVLEVHHDGLVVGGLLRRQRLGGPGGLERGLRLGELGGVAATTYGVPGDPLGLASGALELLGAERLGAAAGARREQRVVGDRAERGGQDGGDAIDRAFYPLAGKRLLLGGGKRAEQPGRHRPGRGGCLSDDDLIDVEEPGLDKVEDDLAGLVEGEAAFAGELGDRADTVDLAQQRPGLLVDRELGVARAGGRQRGYGGGAVDGVADPLPGVLPVGDLGEQRGDLTGRGDVLAGAFVDSELPGADGPAEQVRDRLVHLLADEGLDDGLVDVAQVNQQLAEAPALQLGALGLQRLREGFRAERAAGDQAGAELRPVAGHRHGVQATAAQVEPGGVVQPIGDVQAPSRGAVGELREHLGQWCGDKVALQHARTSCTSTTPTVRTSAAKGLTLSRTGQRTADLTRWVLAIRAWS